MTLIAASPNIRLNNVHSEYDGITMPSGEILPGEALSREFFWMEW